MECTQRLECTQQEFFQSERECPEQIGFLGICGNKYPVKKGPNKIGRDASTCNIVLNLNSVSRQHAVINILNSTEFMIMDLDSANKTKLLGKTLLPYVPLPLKNGDMVQFGDVFGMFRLLEEQSELLMTQALPMTQPIHIPDTPIPLKHVSKLNSATTIPESPDVSDKDDSFIIASQPANTFKSSNSHFIKQGKTISILPIGGNKIDNVYWNSYKKSTSMNLDDSTSSLNDSIPPPCANSCEKENEANAGNIHEIETQLFPPIGTVSIHEMETQPYPLKLKETDSIYEANTQLAKSPTVDSIYTADTQLPSSRNASPIHSALTQIPDKMHTPSIYSQETQVLNRENLPVVREINKQQDMQFNLCIDRDKSIYTAETQMFPESPIRVIRNSGSPSSRKPNENSKLDIDDVVLFDEIDSQPDDDNFESQAILTEDILLPSNNYIDVESEPLSQIAIPKSSKRNMRIKSDSSTDCDEIDDDILPTQRIPEKERKVIDGDSTDCEDEMIELKIDKKPDNTAEKLDLEDVATQVIEVLETSVDNEDILTQVIDIAEVNDSEKLVCVDSTKVIVQVGAPVKRPSRPKPISDKVEISPFKVPLKSVLKAKKQDGSSSSRTPKIKAFSNIERHLKVENMQNDDTYYQNTQDILHDLCSQRESPEMCKLPNKSHDDKGNNVPQTYISHSSSDVDEKIDNFVSTLSSQEVRDVIGVERVAPLKRGLSLGSDASDLENTPKKVRPLKCMYIDLPNSQEIKTSVSLSTKSLVIESSSESESEQNSEDQCTPILFRKKKKAKHDVITDLTKKFNVEALPTRVITRVRKPTSKLQENESKKSMQNILKPKFLTEQDYDVDREILTENITRLKSKNVKETTKVTKLNETKDKDETRQLHETKKLNIQDKRQLDKNQNIEKESTTQLKTEVEKSRKAVHKSEEIPKEEMADKKESKRKQKSSSPLDDSKDDTDHVKTLVQSNATSKPVERIDISEDIDKSNQTKKLKRNTKTTAPKIKEEKRRGPIMIEPHTITAPVKEEKPKKRENKRKNNEPPAKTVNKLENHNFTIEIKSETVKVQNIEEQKRPLRSTRARKKQLEDSQESTKVLVDTETEEKPKRRNKSKEASPERELRRSRRQRTVKEKEEVKEPVVKSILKKNATMQDQSTIYNLSGSGSESPKNLKRANEFEAPVPKRTRSAVNASMRATPISTQKTCYVLFTAFPYEDVKSKLEKLGAVVVTDVMQCTVLLTLQIRRTFKLLCALGLGKPIVGPDWVQACADANMIVDPSLYLIKDLAAEKRFRFTLEGTLAGRRNFLRGYNVSSTPGVLPQASEMKLIVQCSGGTWKEGGPRWLCLSGTADKALWPALKARGAILVTTEIILGGVLQQRLDIEANAIKMQ